MRPHFIKTAIAVLMCAPFTASGSLAEWEGSYSADGQCFCAGGIAQSVGNRIVPTPIGGQTVDQVCQRIGEGPGLKLTGDKYNFPVYADAQCGHGPFLDGVAASNSSCVGSLDGKGTDSASCQPVGPTWNVKKAFSTPASGVADNKKLDQKAGSAQPVVKTQTVTKSQGNPSESLLTKPVVTSISVQRADKKGGKSKTLKATVISSASTAGRKLPNSEPLAPFTGRIVNLGGKRYMQARDDLPAKGGEEGSRIVLDGLVFLLDDGSINATDLHRTWPEKKKTPKKKTSKKKLDKTLGQNVGSESQQEPVIASARNTLQNQRLVIPSRVAESQNAGRLRIPSKAPTDSSGDLTLMKKSDSLPATPAIGESLSTQATNQVKQAEESAVSQVTRATDKPNAASSPELTNSVGLLTALKLPTTLRDDRHRFAYVEAMPISYDVGGSGMLLKGSGETHSKFHYVGKIGATDTYQEVMLGGGYYLTPRFSDRFTMVLQAGIEYGSFRLKDDQDASISANYSDSGLYFGAATRLSLNHKFELRGGLGYSTFFQGDSMVFGGAYWHMTPRLDVVSQFELGDNDLLGLGFRYYY